VIWPVLKRVAEAGSVALVSSSKVSRRFGWQRRCEAGRRRHHDGMSEAIPEDEDGAQNEVRPAPEGPEDPPATPQEMLNPV
jgi:hypothetical protein